MWEEHQAFCEADFYDKSGSMEVEGALRIWKRSVERYKLRYTEMISDGDASTFSKVSAARPYGSNHPITKHECIGHVQKRMYNHLKEMKKKGNRGADGKIVRIGGRNRLTNELMKKFQKYYGKAIRSNVSSIQEMKDAVMATFFHSCSTDTNPHHHLCPSGTTSWCKHRRAEATGEPPPRHRTTIVAEIAPFVRKVYEDLSADSLLERCLLGASPEPERVVQQPHLEPAAQRRSFLLQLLCRYAVDLAVITFNSGQGALEGAVAMTQVLLWAINCEVSGWHWWRPSVDGRVQGKRACEEEETANEIGPSDSGGRARRRGLRSWWTLSTLSFFLSFFLFSNRLFQSHVCVYCVSPATPLVPPPFVCIVLVQQLLWFPPPPFVCIVIVQQLLWFPPPPFIFFL